MKCFFSIAFCCCLLATRVSAQRDNPDTIKVKGGLLTIQPITHATMVLGYKGKTVYVDPTGGAGAFEGLAAPDMILITDIHGDHFDEKTIAAINKENTLLVVPPAVADSFTAHGTFYKIEVLKNGDKSKQQGIRIKAIPMYNLPQDSTARHTKGRGNGYVLTIGKKQVYVSGDTEDIPEMRSLAKIDVAFVCMNLPYTMDIHQAASAVLQFKPGIVYPYHHRGQDINAFKTLVNTRNENIVVRLKNWYPSSTK